MNGRKYFGLIFLALAISFSAFAADDCRTKCLDIRGGKCFILPKSAFNKYPGQLERLLELAESTKPGEHGIFSLGADGSVDTQFSLGAFGQYSGPRVLMTMTPTSTIYFERTKSQSLRLDMTDPTNSPSLSFHDADLDSDWAGQLMSMDFIDGNPVFEFRPDSCLYFQ